MDTVVAEIEGLRAVRPLTDAALHDPAVGGGKAAALSRLAREGFPVPEGFVLAADACERAARDEGQRELLVREAARAARGLGAELLAVRSSAVTEDGADASFAGQLRTVLSVRGEAELAAAIDAVLASAHAAAIGTYRARVGAASSSGVAVLVQTQVEPEAAGVAFTADPVSGDGDRVLVSATRGLGDRLASGAATPQEWAVDADGNATLRADGPAPAITAEQAFDIASLARRVEAWAGVPQDIEWATARGVVYLLQARPITALPTAPVVDLPAGTWIKESGRRAEPLTPFGASVALPIVVQGLSEGFAIAGSLLDRIEQRSIGGEVYLRIVPVGGPRAEQGSPPPWWLLGLLARVAPPLRARCRAARRACRPGAVDEFAARWERERARIVAASRALRECDVSAMSDIDLEAHLRATIELLREGLAMHFEVVAPYSRAVHELVVVCRELLGYDDVTTLELLAGTSVASSEPVRALSRVAQLVADPARVGALLGDSPADALRELATIEPRAAAAFETWRDTYAWRVLGEDPGAPTLAEWPALLAMTLRDALDGRPNDVDERRKRAVERARAGLAHRPAPQRERFESALAAAARIYPAREDTAVWAACHPGGLVRRAIIEAGRRFVAAGALSRADDVVFLGVHTVSAALRGQLDGVRAEAARARAEQAWVAAHPGPQHYGPPPSPMPDVRGLPAAARRMNEALMWSQNHQHARSKPAEAGAVLRGAPGSPGQHTGTVRIVRAFADFDRIQSGDVVVCAAADPSWSVIYGAIGGIVTEGGGALSHAAIVAREHAVPAVLAVGGATNALRDGQLVTVDGTAGTVTPAVLNATAREDANRS